MTFRAHLTLPPESQAQWERAPTISGHNLADCPLFQDAALIELLDSADRSDTYALHMGTDPMKPQENRMAVHEHLSGEQLLDAVKTGRLWLNVTRIGHSSPALSDVVQELYSQLSSQLPAFDADITTVTLLISSPGAMVYYHVDAPANLLWHIRGEKRIWIYPPEERYISRVDLEDIFASAKHEYVDYDPNFDERATVLDLTPGMVASWQPNSPHRVVNGNSLNVSLSTEHFTPPHRAKARVYQANRLIRQKLGVSGLSTRASGIRSMAKQVAWAAAMRLGQVPSGNKTHVPVLRVTPGAPGAVGPL